jgi:hypothetical protein
MTIRTHARSWRRHLASILVFLCKGALQEIVRARIDSEQPGIGHRSVVGVMHDQLHLAADAREPCLHLEFQSIAGAARRGGRRQKPFYLERFVKPLSVDPDLDVLGFDVDPIDEHHEDGSDRVWG